MSRAVALEKALAALLLVDLPSGPDFHYSNTFASFREPARELRGEIRRLLLKLQGRFGSQEVDAEELGGSEEGGGALGEMVEGLLDDLLERVDASLDRARAQLKANPGAPADVSNMVAAVAAPPAASQVAGRNAAADKRARHAFAAAHTDVGFGPRPQDTFDPPVDNSNTPFRPRLDHWACLQGNGGDRAASVLYAHAQRLGLAAAESQTAVHVHPLEGVLENLTYQEWQLQSPEPQLPQGLDETPLTYVDTPDGLRRLAEALSAAREVAIDLEAHSYRSFQGFCCLMQVSTRTADYLVDVIALRRLVGPVLAPVFADTKVVKVLHGSDSDIVWLQRDFGIYVANLFDTGQAARVLSFTSAGLAYLLSHFCSVKADKRWQLADWRVRPLSAEALHYARLDTHYLLYIYDCLKVELAKIPRVPDHLQEEVPERGPASCMGVVLERSRLLCLQRYEKELFTETFYLEAYRRCQERLTREQLAVFAGLYAWRDRTARERDESTGFVLSRAQLVKLAKRAPSNVRDLRAALGDQGRRSAPLLVELAGEVVEVIANAQQQVDGVPDPDELPGDRRKPPSPAAAIAARECAVDDAFAAADAEAAGGCPPGHRTGDLSPAGGASEKIATTRCAAPSSVEAAAKVDLHRRSEGTLAQQEGDERTARAPAGTAAGPVLPPLVPKQLAPLGGSARVGSGLGAMLAGGPRQTSGLGAVFGGSPQSLVVEAPNDDSAAGVAAEPAAAKPLPSTATPTLPVSTKPAASFGVSSGLGAKQGAGQPAGTFGTRSSSLGATLGASSNRASSGLGALLGGKKAMATPGPSSMGSLVAHRMPASGAADQATKDAVEQLKAQFALPFGLSGASAAAPVAAPKEGVPEPQAPTAPETAAEPATPEEARAMQAAPVRDVMEQLRSENRFDMLQPGANAAAAAQGSGPASRGMATEEQLDQPEEFLPLPISEQYKLPSKKPRRAGRQTLMTGGRPHGPIGQPSPAGGEPEPELSPEERERLRCAADVRATLAAVGLGEEAAAHSEAAIGQARPASKKQKKGSRKSAAPLDAAETAGKLQKKTGQSKKQSNQPAQQGNVPQAGNAARGAAPVTEHDVIPFDFAAARASAEGLDISGVIGGRGRGGRGGRGTRGGGRGGRDRRSGAGRDGGERGMKRKGFNPWDAIQEEAVKGGKRSAVMPRSGNRTMTFG